MERVRSQEDAERLEAAFGRYERAQLEGERAELTAARLHLCRTLEASGWTVPADVREQMARDLKTLRKLAEQDERGAYPADDLLRLPSHRTPWLAAGEREH